MILFIGKNRNSVLYRLCSFIVLFAFVAGVIIPPQYSYAQNIPSAIPALNLPAPGTMVPVSPGYSPALIRGVQIFPDNPLKLNFIVDRGEERLQAYLRGEPVGRMPRLDDTAAPKRKTRSPQRRYKKKEDT